MNGLAAALAFLIAGAAAPACSAPPPAAGGPDTPVRAPARVTEPTRPAPACQAPRFQKYVGRPVSSLPPKPRNAVWRVACASCALTEDYNPSRLNVIYDDRTRIVTRVWCG